MIKNFKRADPVQMRKSLELVNELKKAGIRFFPIPVLSDDDFFELAKMSSKSLDQIIKQYEKDV